jgi:hypothetical protein
MRAIVMLSGFLFAACLGAGLPARAMDLSEHETVVDPEWAGDVVWKRQLGTSGFDAAFGVATDATGNVLIAGSKGEEAFVAKYNPSGKLLWTRQTGDAGEARGVATDAGGNVLIAGSKSGDASVAKYSPSGKLLWRRQLSSPDPRIFGDVAYGVATDTGGNVLITGTTDGPLDEGSEGAFVAKYSPSGKLLWKRQTGSSDWMANSDKAYGVATDAGGNVLIAGTIYLTCFRCGEGPAGAFLVKYSPSGKLLWKRQALILPRVCTCIRRGDGRRPKRPDRRLWWRYFW